MVGKPKVDGIDQAGVHTSLDNVTEIREWERQQFTAYWQAQGWTPEECDRYWRENCAEPEPVTGLAAVDSTDAEPDDYQVCVSEVTGLDPVMESAPDLREFCGQSAPSEHQVRLDHQHVWTDPATGEDVITCELYGLLDRPEYVAELRALFDALPITVQAQQGVRGEDSTLLILRRDPSKPALPAEFEPEPYSVIAELNKGITEYRAWVERQRRDQEAHLQSELSPLREKARRTTQRPTTNSVKKMLLKVLNVERERERPGYLYWAGSRLYIHYLAGHLKREWVEHLITGMAREIGLTDAGIPLALAYSWQRAINTLTEEEVA